MRFFNRLTLMVFAFSRLVEKDDGSDRHGLTVSVETRRASARRRATVFAVPGTTLRGARSARGTRTKRRDVMRGWGTVSVRVAILWLP